MRLGWFHALAWSIVAVLCGLAATPARPAVPRDALAVACPGAAAFIQRGKERSKAAARDHATAPPIEPALKDELRKMAARDQSARRAFFFRSRSASNFAKLMATDAANLARLKKIVDQFGFPTAAMVGRKGMQNAWLLTQHADKDPAFQKRILRILRARPTTAVPARDLANLQDRIRIHEGKLQIYGSNFDLKTLQPTPIEDPRHVDERRARVGLMPLADYSCVMRHMYPTGK